MELAKKKKQSMEKLRTNKVEDSAVEMTLPSPSGGLVFLGFFFFLMWSHVTADLRITQKNLSQDDDKFWKK